MPRGHGTVPPEAIRIEEEVWEEAFARREPASDNRRRRLRAIEGGQSDWLDGQSDWLSERKPRPHAAPRAVPAEPRRPSSPDETDESDLSPATWLAASAASGPQAASAARGPQAASAAPRPRAASAARGADQSRAALRPPASSAAAPAPVRRTVKIQGRGAERNLPLPDATRRRSSKRPYERAGFRPDRLAMWAVLLGFVLVFVAIASGHG